MMGISSLIGLVLLVKFVAAVNVRNEVHAVFGRNDEQILPTNKLTGEEGSYVTVHFKNYFDNVKSCQLISFDKTRTFELSDSKNDIVEGLEIHGECGVRMRLNSSWPNKWTLRQENENGEVMSGTFEIQYNPKSTTPQEKSEIWFIGHNHTIQKMDSNIKFCQLVKPNLIVIPLHSSKCTYTVEQVDLHDGGTWKLQYAPMHSMNITTQEIKVSVIDSQKVDWIMTREKNNVTHLQCRNYLEEMNFCLFTTPKGKIINARPGFQDKKYKYYGTPKRTVAEQNFSQCGLTIDNLSEDDYGIWTVTINSLNSSLNITSTYILSGLEKKSIENLKITAPDVLVRPGDNFTVKCVTERSLEYCAMVSPNKTVYSVSKNPGNVPYYLPYAGEGVASGVCGAYIEKADETHNGVWKCLPGVIGHGILSRDISVKVSAETGYIVPQETIINVKIDEEPKLIVRAVEKEGFAIKYCRWVHPKGDEFFERYLSKYQLEHYESFCSVTLKEIRQEDFGTWKCYVGFDNGFDGEDYTTISVVQNKLE